ncbi:hypothetical protein DL98DRAFT_318555 [Cadophora sp. DSE1049]|nr:hypothetical protein DL98DRAFT_318555 [Cadophora sp. DSE1049]
MYNIPILIFALGLLLVPSHAADAPDLSQVILNRVFYSGTGCSAGSATGYMPLEKASFTLTFDLFRLDISPTASVAAGRKNCLIYVDIAYPMGVQYLVANTTFAGNATLDKGVTLSQQTGYYYSDRDFMTSTNATIEGPKTGTFEITSEDPYKATNMLWSPCGRLANLNIYLRVFLKSTAVNATGVFPSDLPGGLLGQFNLITGIVWRTCV